MVKPIIDDRRISIFWLIAGIAFVIYLSVNYNKGKNEEIDNLETKLASEMEILIQANSQLSKYRLDDNISMVFSKFVQNNPYVIAIQMYQFTEKNLRGNTILTAKYIDGDVTVGENINAIHQHNYQCKSSIVRQFRQAKELFEQDGDGTLLVDFILSAYDQLCKGTIDDLDQEDAVLCSLMYLSLEMLENEFGVNMVLGDKEEELRKLLDHYRTGIFRGAILKGTTYTFTHTKENAKLDRQYMTQMVTIRDEKRIFLIALDSSVLDADADENLTAIKDNLEGLLNELENVYNIAKERVGD